MTSLAAFSSELAALVARAEPSVLAVRSDACTATGVAWSKDLVVTTARTIDAGEGVSVNIGGVSHKATLLGTDVGSDLAVLKVDAELTPLPRASLDTLRVGELAIGLGRSEEGLRARLGIVSALGAGFRLRGGTRLDRFVESDLAPLPVLAGGPLLDASGALIGINRPGLVRHGLVTLPAASLDRVVDAIAASGRVERAYLGVALQPVRLAPALSAARGQAAGLIVLGVEPDGPAERAGVLIGDVLLAVGGARLGRVEDLMTALDGAGFERAIELELSRGGSEQRLAITPGKRP